MDNGERAALTELAGRAPREAMTQRTAPAEAAREGSREGPVTWGHDVRGVAAPPGAQLRRFAS